MFFGFVSFKGRDARGFRIFLIRKEEISTRNYFSGAGGTKNVVVFNS